MKIRHSYSASKGGHAPGTLRDAFEAFVYSEANVDDYWPEEVEEIMEGDWDNPPKEKTVRWLLGQLYNCTDIMDRDLCNELDLDQGSTYAQGVRALLSRE